MREQVFVDEQGLGEYERFVDPEVTYLHFLVVAEGVAVGTARMSLKRDGVLIEHVAVVHAARGQGSAAG